MHVKWKKILIILRVFWIKKTIPLTLVGYEMIVAYSYPKHICLRIVKYYYRGFSEILK